MSEAYSVKETLEVLEALKVLASHAGSILEDGKINIKDLPVFLGLLKNVGALKAGAEGADVVPKELKDLSQEEAALVLAKVYEIVSALKQIKE